MKQIVFVCFLLFSNFIFSQNDTIVLKNGNTLYGEIKGLQSGVLTMKTSYSDKDFAIEFREVTELKIQKICFILLSYGRRRTGYLSSNKSKEVTLTNRDGSVEVFKVNEIITLQEISDVFWKRFSGNIDFAYDLTKANNANQFTVAGGLKYKSDKWMFNTDINSLKSKQDNTLDIERTNFTTELTRLLTENWYLLSTLGFLSNTEQALDGRYSIRVGGGRYMVITNKLFFGVSLGFNFNIENFLDEDLNKESTELFVSGNFSMFDYKDFKLDTGIDIYPSISESGRWRIDYKLNLKYDLPYDFYVKLGFQFNYDNQSAALGSDFDYIFNTGFGWKFD